MSRSVSAKQRAYAKELRAYGDRESVGAAEELESAAAAREASADSASASPGERVEVVPEEVIGAVKILVGFRGMASDTEIVNVLTRLVADAPIRDDACSPVRLLTDTLKAIREEHEGALDG